MSKYIHLDSTLNYREEKYQIAAIFGFNSPVECMIHLYTVDCASTMEIAEAFEYNSRTPVERILKATGTPRHDRGYHRFRRLSEEALHEIRNPTMSDRQLARKHGVSDWVIRHRRKTMA